MGDGKTMLHGNRGNVSPAAPGGMMREQKADEGAAAGRTGNGGGGLVGGWLAPSNAAVPGELDARGHSAPNKRHHRSTV